MSDKAIAVDSGDTGPIPTEPTIVQRIKAQWERHTPAVTSAFAAKALAGILVAVGSWSVGLPLIMIAIYAAANGLPYFEVMDALGNNANQLVGLSLIATVALTMLFLLPGFIKIFDPANLPPSGVDGFGADDVARYNRSRWAWAFVPGLAVAISPLLLLIGKAETIEERVLWLTAAVFPCAFLGLTLARDMKWRVPGIEKVIDSKLKARLAGMHAEHLLATNGTGALYFWFYFLSAAEMLRNYESTSQLDSLHPVATNAIAGVFIGALGMSVFAAATAWGNRVTVFRIMGAVSLGMFVLLALWPTGNQLMSRYLHALSQGGGKPVILTTDPALAFEWPEIFEQPTGDAEPSAAQNARRTKVLRLALLGKSKVFVFAPAGMERSNIPRGTPLMIDRSSIKGMAFLVAKEKEKPATQPSEK